MDVKNQAFGPDGQLPAGEELSLEEHERLSPHILFEIIRRDGEEELARPRRALVFSGLAAGLIISFSFLFKAVLTLYLPNFYGAELIACLGYSTGFVMVILGRMQLFTENTITTVIPLFRRPSPAKLLRVLRLWGLVFLSNLLGTSMAALFLSNPWLVSPDLAAVLHDMALHVAQTVPAANIIRGVPAGILIAALVWMMPVSRSFSFFLIVFFTYFIALGGFSHVVVGSCEMAYAVLQGDATLLDYFLRFLLPTGIGNVLGGTFVFTLLVYAQVSEELKK